MSIIWSAQARKDLRAVKAFIARDSEFYAQQQINRLIERVEYISMRPAMGHPVHEFPTSGLRETHEGGYRIIYAFDDVDFNGVTIVHMKQMLRRRRLGGKA